MAEMPIQSQHNPQMPMNSKGAHDPQRCSSLHNEHLWGRLNLFGSPLRQLRRLGQDDADAEEDRSVKEAGVIDEQRIECPEDQDQPNEPLERHG